MHNKQTYTLEILTPVHIGDGLRKVRDIDYYTDNYQTYMVDVDQFATALVEHDPKTLPELEYLDRNNSIGDLIQRHRSLVTDEMIQTYPLKCKTREILTGIHDGMGRPMIPGSSLKGSLRTALLATWFAELSPKDRDRLFHEVKNPKKSKGADQSIVKSLFGKKPNYNIMRALQTSDAYFEPDEISLIETKIFNLGYDGSWSWKSIRGKSAPMRNTLEVLTRGSTTTTQLTLDLFLLGKSGESLRFPRHLPDNQDDLIRLVNNHSRDLLEAEMDFFEDHDPRNDLDGLYRNLDIIRRGIPHDNSAMVLRLGWGTGWNSMTGDYIDKDWLLQFRQQFHMGKRGVDHFPKTRTIALEKNQPIWPMGWIKLTKE